MGVSLYIEVKRNKPKLGMFPLCIDASETNVEESHSLFVPSGEIVCVEGLGKDTQTLAMVESTIHIIFLNWKQPIA